jgi:glycosyltransferase involved in cell wall biosynthesis
MKFTIYTSFYNYLDTADDLCQSIINQTYSNWEWLITDDFSDSSEVKTKLKQLSSKDKRIKIIKSKWKKQYYYNLPTEHSTGDIIVKLDSDDIPSIKLLEVYKYNYEKFPNVISIGSSSLLRKNLHTGMIAGAKYINYRNTSNYKESSEFKVTSVVGDARSYRINKLKNNGVFVSEKDFKFQRGEDVHKSYIIEEWGEFISLPRILYHYTMRDDSNTGGLTVNTTLSKEINEKQHKFFSNFIKERNDTVSRDTLFSIEKYYDSSFDHLKNFYFTGLDSEINRSKIEYWSDKVLIDDMKKIRDLYYDHEIVFNKRTDNPNYVIIDGLDGISTIEKSIKDRKLSNTIITITTKNENRDVFMSTIRSMGYPCWFNIFNYLTLKITT